jgi:D-arabinose 1-dehydrogenase-like Zn-dependent alcohol dehydrogenase
LPTPSVTMYSPLVRNGAGPGKKVGIVGVGGLGHFGVMFAKALGAEVYALCVPAFDSPRLAVELTH